MRPPGAVRRGRRWRPSEPGGEGAGEELRRMPGAGVLEGFGAGSEASGRPRPPRWKKNRAAARRRRDEEEQRKEKNGRRKGMTCGVPMSVSEERGLQQGHFGLYDNTVVCLWAQSH